MKNEAAERLRRRLNVMGSLPGLNYWHADLDAALAEERRHVIEQIKERIAVVREGGYSIEANLPAILALSTVSRTELSTPEQKPTPDELADLRSRRTSEGPTPEQKR